MIQHTAKQWFIYQSQQLTDCAVSGCLRADAVLCRNNLLTDSDHGPSCGSEELGIASAPACSIVSLFSKHSPAVSDVVVLM